MFPNSLKQYRKCFDLSRSEVADLIGLEGTKALSKWEKGISMPDALSFLKLCIFYSVQPIDLYGEVMRELSQDLKSQMEVRLPIIEY